MCGIAGIYHRQGRPVEPSRLEKMVATLNHRGPDAHGVFSRDGVGLAHSRLSIIDLSGGKQPMQTPDGRLTVTFNGEIFNYVELREELIAKGYQFQSRSDTEVILHLYAEYGDACTEKMNGQWAFAVWDARERRLFVSRDRLGIRPLYYTQAGDEFLFASEIKAIFTQPTVSREIDPIAVDQLFTFWSPVSPRTVFEAVLELPPGCNLTIDRDGINVRPYWQLDYAPEQKLRPLDDYVEELLSLMIDATRLRLRSDVSVGAYLSGGLDSSFTTALIKRFTDAPLKTFSVAFTDADYDESDYQQQMVRHLQTDHHEVRCTYDDIGRVFPSVVWHTEKPVLRTAPAPLYLLSRLVHENGFKVVMTGEGADEMFGGYDIFKEDKIRRFWGRDLNSQNRPLLLKRLYPYMKNLQAQSPAYLQAFFSVRPEDLQSPFFSHLPRWELTAKLKAFYSAGLKQRLIDADPYAEFKTQLPASYADWPAFCRAQYLETTNLMPGYILSSQGDRMAMANSVEGRFPFLDHRVAEFAANVPPVLKMKGLNEKFLLKKAAEQFIPRSISQRHKQPYRAPDANSFIDADRGRTRFEYVAELLSPDSIAAAGLFNPTAVEKLRAKIERGMAIGTKDNMALVGILSTQLLIEQFINQREVTAKATTAELIDQSC